ncbi:MAG: rhamnogalacturonan lyase [Phycisphaerae bacterium]|nr:rhamnogalacturonan lyase [Phycisphaerae bacterium]
MLMKVLHWMTCLVVGVTGPVWADMARHMEALDRGVVAVAQADGQVFVSWRVLGTEPEGISFNVYRDGTKINREPMTGAANLMDASASATATYTVSALINGIEADPSAPSDVWMQPFLEIPLKTPEGYQPNDASVGDLDGDGRYDIVVHMAGRGRDNSQAGDTDPPIFDAYTLDGTHLWRINLGRNIREGAHYTQFMVYDLDSDGKAEFACKTADGTLDGAGKVIGDANADYVNSRGMILSGSEYLTIFNGQTGQAMATVPYVPSRDPEAGDNPSNEQMQTVWGDSSGNRMDRFLACVAYLDGERPSLVMCRGYYSGRDGKSGCTFLAAWNWRDKQLTPVWTFDSRDGQPGHADYNGQGYHSLSVADVDHDGFDEIIYGACAIDHDGTGMYSTGLGHGDALHVSDMDPDRPGLEAWGIHENPRHDNGANLRDPATGQVIFGLKLTDPGRGLAMDIDPRYKGYECWANNSPGLFSVTGEKISDAKPSSCNMAVWWDGDLLRELLDGVSAPRPPRNASQTRPRRGGFGGARVGVIDKWNPETGTTTRLLNGGFFGSVTNNGTKANPCLCADILGDWREEVIWNADNGKSLRIFSTTIPTPHRLVTLMHDPVYRLSVAWQNVAYNQPAHTGFYLGDGMAPAPRPNIVLAGR